MRCRCNEIGTSGHYANALPRGEHGGVNDYEESLARWTASAERHEFGPAVRHLNDSGRCASADTRHSPAPGLRLQKLQQLQIEG